jgi:hypothetical protein
MTNIVFVTRHPCTISKDYLYVLGKFESIFETALAHKSGHKGDSLMRKKTKGRKSCDAVPFNWQSKH